MTRFLLWPYPGGTLPETVPPTTALAGLVDLGRAPENSYVGLHNRYPGYDVIGVTQRGQWAQVFDATDRLISREIVVVWANVMREQGVTPWVYCSDRMFATIRSQCVRKEITPPLWWSSIIRPGAFMPDGASATRYATHNNYGSHLIRDDDDTPPLVTNPTLLGEYL